MPHPSVPGKSISKERFFAAMLGLAAGDALGVPAEFRSREELKQHPVRGMTGYGAHNQPEGTWSDDTSMTLCCADSLSRGFDLSDMMNRFSDWIHHRKYTAAGVVFDVGVSCRKALNRYSMGYDPEFCGNTEEATGNGNGSLMRMLPVSLWRILTERHNHLPDAALLAPIHAASALTHAHPRSQVACGIYTLMIDEWLLSSGADSLLSVFGRAYDRAEAYCRELGGPYEAEIAAGNRFIRPERLISMPEDMISSTGYVVDTLNAALWCLLTTSSYEECMLKAVNLGEDTDTTAAVSGGLAGLIYGMEGIPSAWLKTLKNRELIEQITERLYISLFGKEESAEISEFTGGHAHLAMKYHTPVCFGGMTYENAQSAWLAQGVPEEYRDQFTPLNAHQARRLMKQLPVTDDWDARRIGLLYEVCLAKYAGNPPLREQLTATGTREIIYDTTGAHDNELGRCLCRQCLSVPHQNLLGKILMRVREELAGSE